MKLQGYSYRDHSPIEVNIVDDRIESIIPYSRSTSPKTEIELSSLESSLWSVKTQTTGAKVQNTDSVAQQTSEIIIGPGFTDIQVNGYGGVDYNEVYANPTTLSSITQKLYTAGTTSHFPTIITNSSDQISTLIKQIIALRKQDQLSRWSIEGLHIEGPFISPVDGPRGAHPKKFVCAPDWNLIKQWQDDADGLIRIITLSPEWENSNEFIEQCVEHNIIVSIGHTNATHQQLYEAVSAGARLSTHLGNGMHPILARHPNYLWSQLADDRLSASIIADGFHLPVEVIRVFKKVKNDKLILVSDSVSLAGMPAGDYDLHIGGEVTLTNEGKLHLRNNPSIFAGSSVNIKECISFLVHNNLVSLAEAWEMASVRPKKLIHSGNSVFEKGAIADLVILRKNHDGQLEIIKTIKKGKEVYSG